MSDYLPPPKFSSIVRSLPTFHRIQFLSDVGRLCYTIFIVWLTDLICRLISVKELRDRNLPSLRFSCKEKCDLECQTFQQSHAFGVSREVKYLLNRAA